MNDEEFFNRESNKKKLCYVGLNETVVRDEGHVIHIDLGSCVSVILCGIDDARRVWFGANHLFKSRVENSDCALEQVAGLYNSMTERNVGSIHCLGLFGAAYTEKSLAKSTAQKNVLTVMEALSLYNLNVEIFQTGFIQGISVLKSDEKESFLIRHCHLNEKTSRIIEIPLIQLFR